jgi:hypothetical protein
MLRPQLSRSNHPFGATRHCQSPEKWLAEIREYHPDQIQKYSGKFVLEIPEDRFPAARVALGGGESDQGGN